LEEKYFVTCGRDQREELMSRIGKLPVAVPDGVEITLDGAHLVVKGSKGMLRHTVPSGITLELKDDQIHVTRNNDSKKVRSLHGLTRTLVANMVTGTTQGFQKKLNIVGVGYRANVQGRLLQLSLGYSHPIRYTIPDGIDVSIEEQTKITVSGIDKQKVGQTAAEIRSFRKPEPYKGKGISYADEVIRRKVGKSKG
jgi:large subunit ribosomal protein L6